MPSPGDLPDPGMEPRFLALQADSLVSVSPGKPIITQLNLEAKLHLCPSHKFSISTEGNSADDTHKWREYLQDKTEVILYHTASFEVFQQNICIAILHIDHF